MKKLFILLTMLIVGIGSSWADVPDDIFSTNYENAVWLSLANKGKSNYVMLATSATMGTRAKGSANYASWQQIAFVGNKDGFKIYSYSQGSNKALKAASDNPGRGTTVSWVEPSSASTWVLHDDGTTEYGVCLSGKTSYSLNMYAGAGNDCKFYDVTDGGSRWTISKTSNLVVEDGKVYKISSHQYSGSNYQIINSATASQVINTGGEIATNQGYWVCKKSNEVYTFESAMADGKYIGWRGLSTTAEEYYLNFATATNNTTCISLYRKDSSTSRYLYVHKNASGGTDGWNQTSSGAFADAGSTDYIFEEVTGVDVYTVVSNIKNGGVTYTPSYTGTATQTKGGFYVLASAPSASDFTAIALNNCTPGAVTVDASAKTITINYTLSPIQITDASNISSTKVYRLRNDRTAIYAASASATSVSATTTAAASTLNVEEPLNQWAFVEKDSKKYLYNVGAKKFVKTSPYVDYNTSGYGKWDNTHNFLESYTTHEVQISTYTDIAGRFWLKDVKSGRTRVYNSNPNIFTINGWTISDGPSITGNGWIIEEIPEIAFDPTEALATLGNSISYTFRKVNGDTDEDLTSSDEERDVATGSTLNIAYNEYYYTPILKMKEITVNGSSTAVGSKTISDGDVIAWVYRCPFNVSDEPSNGNWAANTYWHFLDIHTSYHYYLNIPENFDYSNLIPANTTTKSASYDDGYLWCITGNNTDGYRLYNKRAGATKVMTYDSANGAYIRDLSGNEDASLFTMKKGNLQECTGAPTFQFSDATTRPNYQSGAVKKWSNAGTGSEFTFEPIEESIIEDLANNYMPYFVQNIGNVCGLSWDDALYTSDLAEEYAAVYGNPTVDGYNTFVTHLNAAKVRPVENAKYHIISAYPNYKVKQGVRKALYYDTSASIFMWKTYDSSDEVFTFQLRKTGDNWNIYNPSASKYLKDCKGNDNASDDPSTFTFTDLGLAQLNISDGTGTMHTAGHSDGAGTSGTITRWGGGLNSASSWYIEPIVETVSALTPASVAKDAYVYQTFANPYDCQISNGEVYYITTQTKSTAHIEQATNNIVPANTGVVLKATKGATINVRPLSVEYDEKLKTENSLVPGDGSTTVTAGNYMLAYSSTDDMAKFYAIGAAGYVVPANKAYLPAEAVGARSLTLLFDDDPTGINSIENEPSANDNVIYNIVGQKLNKMQKGINIVNGKKVLVK